MKSTSTEGFRTHTHTQIGWGRGECACLGMELKTVKVAGRVRDGGILAGVGGSDGGEPLGELGDFITVAHPDGARARNSMEERRWVLGVDIELGFAILTLDPFLDRPAEGLAHELVAVADGEHGDTELEDFRVHRRRFLQRQRRRHVDGGGGSVAVENVVEG